MVEATRKLSDMSILLIVGAVIIVMGLAAFFGNVSDRTGNAPATSKYMMPSRSSSPSTVPSITSSSTTMLTITEDDMYELVEDESCEIIIDSSSEMNSMAASTTSTISTSTTSSTDTQTTDPVCPDPVDCSITACEGRDAPAEKEYCGRIISAKCCSGSAVYTYDDPNNCGGCSVVCPEKQPCKEGKCKAPAGQCISKSLKKVAKGAAGKTVDQIEGIINPGPGWHCSFNPFSMTFSCCKKF